MTLIVAALCGGSTIVVADKMREVGGATKPCRDEKARKIVSAADESFTIAIVGDMILENTGSPELVVDTWLADLALQDPTDRPDWLAQKLNAIAGRPGDNREGRLLLFDATRPNEVTEIRVVPTSGSSNGVNVTHSQLSLAEESPSVWGLECLWEKVGSPITTSLSESETLELVENSIAKYASNNPKAIVSRGTRHAIVRAVR